MTTPRRLLLTLLPVLLLQGSAFARPALQEASPEADLKATEHPLLWRIEGNPPSYLFGTIHVGHPAVLDLHPEVEAAIEKADALYTEIKLDKVSQVRMATELILPDGKKLKDVLPAGLHARLSAHLESKGLNLMPLEKLKIWAIDMQLSLLDDIELFTAGTPLDMGLYENARREGKEVGGVETIDEQIGIFESQTMDEQIASLENTLDKMEKASAEGTSMLRELIRIYLTGDDAALMRAMFSEYDPEDEKTAKFLEKLLFKRNQHMAERSAKMIREHPDKSYFFAFGAAHMPGERGVVDLLEKEGFEVTRIGAPEGSGEPARRAY